MKKLFLLTSLAALAAGSATAQVTIFSNDFSGTAPWGFDSETDPNGQLGGTDQMTYTYGGTNAASYLKSAINISDFTTAETGILQISGTIDLSGITYGTSDFDKRTLLVIGTPGNKNNFDGTGKLFGLGVGGWNNPGEFSLGQDLAVRFGAGGIAAISNFQPAGVLTFTTTLTVSGDDATGWTVEASTDLENTASGTLNMTSTYSRTDTGFNGLQSITGIYVGYNPDGSPVGDAPESLGSGVVVLDNISLQAIPEPSTYAALAGLLALGLAAWRRRR